MIEPPKPSDTGVSTSRRISPKAIAAVVAAVLGGVVLAAVFLNLPRTETSGTDSSPSATAVPTTSPSATPEPSAAPTATPDPTPTPLPAGAAPMAWTAGARMGGAASVVERVGDRWFIGGSTSVNGAAQAAVWTSSDGQVWDGPALLEPEPPGKPADHPQDEPWFPDRYAVIGFGEWQDTLLAFGLYQFGCCDGYAPMLWRSDDGGGTWSLVATEGTAFLSAQIPRESATLPGGELAVFSGTGLGGGAATFVTFDLASWTMNPIGDPDELLSFMGFASTPDELVTVGWHVPPYSGPENRRPEQRAWRSSDGRTWAPMAPPSVQGELWDVAWDPARGRLVMVGTDETEVPRVWVGADAGSWASSPLADEPGRIADLAVTDGLLAAVGWVQASPESDPQPTVWTSHDGVTWSVVELDPSVSPNSIAVTGDAAIITGDAGEDGISPTVIGRLAE